MDNISIPEVQDVSDTSKKKKRLTSDDVSIPDDGNGISDDSISDIIIDLDSTDDEDNDNPTLSDSESSDKSVQLEESCKIDDPAEEAPLDSDEDDINTMTDFSMEDDIIPSNNTELTADDKEDDDPYGLGEPVPGSLAEILNGGGDPTKDSGDAVENSEGAEEVNGDSEDSDVVDGDDDGIDIDSLLDNL